MNNNRRPTYQNTNATNTSAAQTQPKPVLPKTYELEILDIVRSLATRVKGAIGENQFSIVDAQITELREKIAKGL